MSEGSTTSVMVSLVGATPSEVRVPHAYVGEPEVTMTIGSTLFVCKNREAYESLRKAFAELVVAGQTLWPVTDIVDEVDQEARRSIARYGVEHRGRRVRPTRGQLGL